MRSILSILIVFSSLTAQITPGKVPSKSILYLHGQIHDGKGKWIKDGAMGVDNGVITLVKDLLISSVDKSAWDSIVDLKGQHIYPGFIATNSTLGLHEIDAVRAANDLDETGQFLPQLRTLTSYNTDSRVTATVRSNGISIAQIAPRNGIIKGRSSIVHLDAWNWEDAAIIRDGGLWITWTQNAELLAAMKSKIENALHPSKKAAYNSESASLDAFFQQKNYRVYVNIDKAEDILAFISWAESIDLKQVILVGASEAYLISPLLKYHKVSIILDRLHRLPHHEDSEVDQVERNAQALIKDSIPFAISMQGSMERMNTRNLGFQAGQLMQLGYTEDEVLPYITSQAAEIIGIGHLYGSIAVGKSATFFISKGKALDMKSCQITEHFIQGRSTHLDNPQTLLKDKFEAKYKL